MTAFSFSITSLSVQPSLGELIDVVRAAQWRLEASNGVKAYTTGVAEFDEPDPENFTPFDQLTAEQVQAWAMAAIVNLDAIKASLVRRWMAPPWQ